MYTLVTGASGLLGSHLLASAIADGRPVRATSRSIRKRSWLEASGCRVEHWPLDLTGTDTIPDEMLEGVDAVIHCAASVNAAAGFSQEIRDTNVFGTQRLFEKAIAAGVTRWIQISSTAAGIESGAVRSTAYGLSKAEIDRWLADRQGETQLLFVEPGYMLGRWDSRPSSGAVFFWLRFKRMSHFVECEKNFVAAEDVARGIWQALDNDATGRYQLGGVNARISAFIEEACAAMAIDKTVFREVPASAVDGEGGDPGITPTEAALIREFCFPAPLQSEAARLDFAYMPRLGLREMIDEAVTFLKLRSMTKS